LVNDGQPILEARKVTSVVWGRRRDEASVAVVTLPVSGTDLEACCTGVNRIEPLRTEVIVERLGIPVWQGWIMREVDIHRDTITITAHDILVWTERRVLSDDHVYTSDDLTDIALAYIADVNSPGDLPFVITSLPTGILADRTVLASEFRYASEALRELYETGLDVTVIAGHLLLGPEMQACGTLTLRDTDIDGDPSVKIDGLLRATRAIVKGANGITSIYPPSPPEVCFHQADTVRTDESILDQNSADAAALNLYEQAATSYPYFLVIPEGSGLKSTAPVHINALVPGAIVQFYSQTLCVQIGMAMRLVAVDVEAAAGSEQVRISLEPLEDE
jgi:hypothetical protein